MTLKDTADFYDEYSKKNLSASIDTNHVKVGTFIQVSDEYMRITKLDTSATDPVITVERKLFGISVDNHPKNSKVLVYDSVYPTNYVYLKDDEMTAQTEINLDGAIKNNFNNTKLIFKERADGKIQRVSAVISISNTVITFTSVGHHGLENSDCVEVKGTNGQDGVFTIYAISQGEFAIDYIDHGQNDPITDFENYDPVDASFVKLTRNTQEDVVTTSPQTLTMKNFDYYLKASDANFEAAYNAYLGVLDLELSTAAAAYAYDGSGAIPTSVLHREGGDYESDGHMRREAFWVQKQQKFQLGTIETQLNIRPSEVIAQLANGKIIARTGTYPVIVDATLGEGEIKSVSVDQTAPGQLYDKCNVRLTKNHLTSEIPTGIAMVEITQVATPAKLIIEEVAKNALLTVTDASPLTNIAVDRKLSGAGGSASGTISSLPTESFLNVTKSNIVNADKEITVTAANHPVRNGDKITFQLDLNKDGVTGLETSFIAHSVTDGEFKFTTKLYIDLAKYEADYSFIIYYERFNLKVKNITQFFGSNDLVSVNNAANLRISGFGSA
jgi:hypothetical protein